MEANEATGSAVLDEQPEAAQQVYKITFLRKGGESVTVEYQPGATPYHEHGREGSLLDIALNYGIDLEHSCGGNCACTTCHVIVKEGEENLTEMDEDEEDRIYMADSVTLHSRLGCQAVVRGDVTVEIAE
ncbi:MAG TPA: 2Fe-2S iron-sulfur cluster-binding protein [Blastocatellia bacterium]|nr:2Fe-2S iron-sulfur cluster-binding protein [Blastocatellia bacterium]